MFIKFKIKLFLEWIKQVYHLNRQYVTVDLFTSMQMLYGLIIALKFHKCLS